MLPQRKSFARLSLHSHTRRGLVYKKQLSSEQRQLLIEKVAEGVLMCHAVARTSGERDPKRWQREANWPSGSMKMEAQTS